MYSATELLKNFNLWLWDQNDAPRVAYYKGFLARDRWINWQMETSLPNVPVDNLAKAAWAAYENGQVHLVQSRMEEGVYVYWAVKTRKQLEWKDL